MFKPTIRKAAAALVALVAMLLGGIVVAGINPTNGNIDLPGGVVYVFGLLGGSIGLVGWAIALALLGAVAWLIAWAGKKFGRFAELAVAAAALVVAMVVGSLGLWPSWNGRAFGLFLLLVIAALVAVVIGRLWNESTLFYRRPNKGDD